MQHRTHWRVVALVGWLSLLAAGAADAQSPPTSNQPRPPGRQIRQSFRDRPRVSPYTSLANPNGSNVALNYYNIVRPRQQAQRTARRLSNELQSVEANVQSLQQPQDEKLILSAPALTTGRMEPTGHPATFGSLGTYYSGFTTVR
jgi:hypothetical protein